MDKIENSLISESIKEDNFSSNTHPLSATTVDNNIKECDEYTIPDRYFKNRLVILPINKSRYYVYWEFVKDFFYFEGEEYDRLYFKLFDKDGNFLFEFSSNKEYGEYFINKEFNESEIFVKVGFYSGNDFILKYESNDIKVFSTSLKFPEDKDVWMIKERGYTEVIRNSLNHFTIGLSSMEYAKEIRMLEEFEKSHLLRDNSSSFTKAEGK